MAGSVRGRNSLCRTACTRTTCCCPPIKCSSCLPAKVAREAGPHSGLGIDAYVQVTSPLRRYNDCLVHRQLKAFAHRESVWRA